MYPGSLAGAARGEGGKGGQCSSARALPLQPLLGLPEHLPHLQDSAGPAAPPGGHVQGCRVYGDTGCPPGILGSSFDFLWVGPCSPRPPRLPHCSTADMGGRGEDAASHVNPTFAVILEKPIRIPRFLSVKASHVLKGFLNKVCSQPPGRTSVGAPGLRLCGGRGQAGGCSLVQLVRVVASRSRSTARTRRSDTEERCVVRKLEALGGASAGGGQPPLGPSAAVSGPSLLWLTCPHLNSDP